MVPGVQARQVYSALRVHVFTLPYHHAGRGSQEADGRCERKRIQEPQQDGQVIGAPCEYITVKINQGSSEQLQYCISSTFLLQMIQRCLESHLDI